MRIQPSSLRAMPSLFSTDDRETIVKRNGIRPGMGHTAFESKRYGFRLQVQADSLPAHLSQEVTAGPITVSPLREVMDLDGRRLKGILQVHCLPTKRRFDAPLLFDFPVAGGKKDDPIIDKYGRIRYEVRVKRISEGVPRCRRISALPLAVGPVL